MPSLRYLNTILTVLALLLALNLWTSWSSTPGGEVLSVAQPAEAQGIPNAGAQRRDMIDLLKKLTVSVDQVNAKLSSGEIRVQVRVEEGQGQRQAQTPAPRQPNREE